MNAVVPELRAYPATANRRRFLAAIALAGAASLLLFLIVALVVLRSFPNSADEYGYLFAAETFLKGRLWNPAPPPPLDLFLEVTHIFAIDGKWVSQYPPGWPVVLAGLSLVGLPFVAAAPVVGALLVVALG